MAKGFRKVNSLQNNSSKSSSLLQASDCEEVIQKWAEHFENLTDPRGRQGVLHPFMSVVMIAILATIGGARGWEDIEIYGVSHENWLSSFLNLPFGEDACRIRTGNAPENMALLKRWSINLLNQETTFKRSTRQKARRASMDEDYLLKVLEPLISL